MNASNPPPPRFVPADRLAAVTSSLRKEPCSTAIYTTRDQGIKVDVLVSWQHHCPETGGTLHRRGH